MKEELITIVKSTPVKKNKVIAALLLGIPTTSKGYVDAINRYCGENIVIVGGVGGCLSNLSKNTVLGDYITVVFDKGEQRQYYIDPSVDLTFKKAVEYSKIRKEDMVDTSQIKPPEAIPLFPEPAVTELSADFVDSVDSIAQFFKDCIKLGAEVTITIK